MVPMVQTRDLELNTEQRVALAALNAAYLVTRAFDTELGISLHTSVAPFIGQAASAAMSSLQCPYDTPTTEVVTDFDPNKNMYMHCLHGTHHCWSIGGQYITCP